MKILFAHGQFAVLGGAERSMLALMEGLKKKKHRLTLLTEFPLGTGLEVHRRRDLLLKLPIRMLRMFQRAWGAARKADAAVVSVQGAPISLPTTWAVLVASKLSGKRVIAYIHEPSILLNEFCPFWIRLLALPLIALDSAIFRLFKPDAIVTNSSLTKKLSENRYRIKVREVMWPCFEF